MGEIQELLPDYTLDVEGDELDSFETLLNEEDVKNARDLAMHCMVSQKCEKEGSLEFLALVPRRFFGWRIPIWGKWKWVETLPPDPNRDTAPAAADAADKVWLEMIERARALDATHGLIVVHSTTETPA